MSSMSFFSIIQHLVPELFEDTEKELYFNLTSCYNKTNLLNHNDPPALKFLNESLSHI